MDTSSPQEVLLQAVFDSRPDRIRDAIVSGADVNARCHDGASVLFIACLEGDAEIVRLLLDLGADPNLVADDPAAGMYAAKPLDLVMQSQFLLEWERYTPVFRLLIERGATESDGTIPSEEDEELRRADALEWQHRRKE